MWIVKIILFILVLLYIITRGVSVDVETGLTLVALVFVGFAAMSVLGK